VTATAGRLATRRRARGEDGAVLIEAAFVLPVLVLVVFGIIEFGFAFKDAQTVTSATRTGARVGATLARQASPNDYLTAVKAAVQGALKNNIGDSQIQYLTVYKANQTTGQPVSGGGFEGCSTDCARFTFSGGTWVSDGGTAWAPTDMKACGSVGHTDYLGVYVRAKHQNFTPILGNSITIKDHTVMRLEPVVVGGGVTSCE
jgi:hypothetical protein